MLIYVYVVINNKTMPKGESGPSAEDMGLSKKAAGGENAGMDRIGEYGRDDVLDGEILPPQDDVQDDKARKPAGRDISGVHSNELIKERQEGEPHSKPATGEAAKLMGRVGEYGRDDVLDGTAQAGEDSAESKKKPR